MYKITRCATLKNASFLPKAIGWAKEVTGFVNKNYPGFDISVGVEMFGSTNIHWSYQAKSLAELEAVNAKLLQDQKYWAMLDNSKELWVEGSLKDTIVMIVE
ncbi:MAG: hypothetical protein IT383_12315 [Deltaproteobacteria bacterium]|nr:hypothetical protein [Deltaproteobacteria bacterium]